MNEPMTDYQLRTILKMLLNILDNSSDVGEAKAKIEELLLSDEGPVTHEALKNNQ